MFVQNKTFLLNSQLFYLHCVTDDIIDVLWNIYEHQNGKLTNYLILSFFNNQFICDL